MAARRRRAKRFYDQPTITSNTMVEVTPDNINEDNDLEQTEKETNIWFDKTGDRATVFTAEGGIMRRLVQHPEFVVTSVTEKEEKIVAIKGHIPIACLSFGSTPRKQKGHANIVTNGVMGDGEDAQICL